MHLTHILRWFFFTRDINLVVALYFCTCIIRLLFKIESTYNIMHDVFFFGETAQKRNNIILYTYQSAIANRISFTRAFIIWTYMEYTRDTTVDSCCYSFCFRTVFFATGFTRKNRFFPRSIYFFFIQKLKFKQAELSGSAAREPHKMLLH